MTDLATLNRPYQAAYKLLSGSYYNGDISATAERIARIVAAQQERHGMRYMQRLVQSYAARQAIVVQLAGMAEAEGVRGGAVHALPLLDGAVAVAAKALWEEQP
ncbi:hypothetical protein ACIODS_11805 [Micromonospora chalcea]|uniref:hypothetical protein n=1 Tax=Micromonospora chalcea TaxID=1874 RepID=UPI003806E3BC